MNLLPEHGASALFLLYQKDLMRFLTYKVRCVETAADLTQETYLRIAHHPDAGNIENMRAYLFRIANNLALDYLRSQTRQNKRDAGPVTEDIICRQPEPDAALADCQHLIPIPHSP